MSSPITLLLLTTSVWVAWPTPAPPMRKNTSSSELGSAVWSADEPADDFSRTGELVGPASNSRPPIFTPPTSATVIGTTPLFGFSVAMPMPSTTVSGRVTLIVLSSA